MDSSSMSTSTIASVGVGILLSGLTLRFVLGDGWKNRNVSLPPGPGGLPFIGAALDMPKKYEWKTFKEWCLKAGSDIIYFSAMGNHMVVIDSYETAIELLEKRSGIYSSRPQMAMAHLMGNWDDIQFAFSPYGPRWRRKRKLFHQILNEHTNMRYQPLIQKNTSRLLHFLLNDPDNFMHQIHMLAASSVTELAYGFSFDSIDDPRFVKFETASAEVVAACNPGAYLVNIFPALSYIPSWFPGAGFKRYAKIWSDISGEIVRDTYSESKQLLADGKSTPSFVHDALASATSLDAEEEDYICSVAQSIYGAGADTSTAGLQTFVLLMVTHPEIQKRAQEEVSRVCQPGYLPSYSEKESYPYLEAVIMEVLRWGSIVPMGVPHMIESDDIYKGYRIPAGSTIIANAWSMLHNEEMYPDPEAFKPERFLKNGAINPEIRSPYEMIFGFGRRICPGRNLALMSLWTNAAAILTTFDLGQPAGGIIDPEFICGIVLHPAPFKCTIKPRSQQAEKLIKESYQSNTQ